MPLVIITLSKKASRGSVVAMLQEKLQEIVADALHVPEVVEAQLSARDVELRFEDADPRDIGKDIQILVLANWYVDRARNLRARSNKISAKVKKLIIDDELTGFVYVRLAEAGFSEF
jgi:hypothetical protein